MKRKIIAVLAAAMLVAGAGCGSVTETAAPPPEESGQAEENAGTRITNDDITLKLVRADNPSQPMQENLLVTDEIYKRTGVKLEIEAIPGSDFSEKQQTMIATNNMPDILYDTYNIPDFAASGVFAVVSDYLDIMPNFSALLAETPDFKKLYIEGNLYYIPVMGRYIYRFGRSPMIRADLLAETGLSEPETFDDLYALLKAIKDKYPDTYPLANRNGTANLFTCLAYSFGSGNSMYFEPDQGKYLFGQAHEEFEPVLEFLANLYAEGLLDPDYAVASSSQWQEKLASGRSSFFFDNPSFAANFNKALAETDPAMKFAPIPIPASANGPARGLFYEKHDRGATTIGASSQNVDIAMRLMDFLYSEEGCDLTNFGLEGRQYTVSDDVYTLDPGIVAEFQTQTDPLRAFYGSIGAGKLGLARYIDERAQDAFFDAETKAWYETWSTWTFMGEMVIDPPLTEAENEQAKDIRTAVNTILESEYDKFITGSRPISEFAQVRQQIIDAGALTLEEIYNAALARVQ
ncbi:MAG: extracellular solute-binding protein [Clostridiales bacterium]|jgi:putative aldouronate transport system substrate-binding protein|nr:extracellular solute-binding protein [Clostridiales bacterium]